MIKQLSYNITSFLVSEKIIESQEAEIYRYGLKRLFINGISILFVCFIAIIIHKWFESLFFFIGLMPIRAIAGGYHANTPRSCNLLSLTAYLCGLILIDFLFKNQSLCLFGIISIMILLCIYIYAPVDHVNRKLTEAECRQGKKVALRIATIMIITVLTSIIVSKSNSLLATGILTGLLTASISLVVGHFKRRGEKNV